MCVPIILPKGSQVKWFKRENKVGREQKPRELPEEWVKSGLPIFRKLGFFHSEEKLTDAELARKICESDNRYHESLPTDLWDLVLVAEDEDRVWWQDTEQDVCAENEVYTVVVQEWGRISRGAFRPLDITEKWQGDEGPITVGFLLGGVRREIYPEYMDDYIDTGVLRQINDLIKTSGFSFLVRVISQDVFIVVLTSEERAMLERERGWKFFDP